MIVSDGKTTFFSFYADKEEWNKAVWPCWAKFEKT